MRVCVIMLRTYRSCYNATYIISNFVNNYQESVYGDMQIEETQDHW